MSRTLLIGGVTVWMMTVGCSDSSSITNQPPRAQQPATPWSNSVLNVSPQDPASRGVIRGQVVDSTGAADPSHFAPIAGATITLGSMAPPPDAGQARSMAIRVLGTVVTDADGRFLITALPNSYYSLGAEPPDGTHLMGATNADLRAGNETEATIYLARAPQP